MIKRLLLPIFAAVSFLVSMAAIIASWQSNPFPQFSLNFGVHVPEKREFVTWSAGAHVRMFKVWRLRRTYADSAEYMRQATLSIHHPQGWNFDDTDFTFSSEWKNPSPLNRLGFAVDDDEADFGIMRQRAIGIRVPLWAVILASLVLPAMQTVIWVHARRAAGRRRRGECIHCGYDLRATSERCPECGTSSAGEHSTPSKG